MNQAESSICRVKELSFLLTIVHVKVKLTPEVSKAFLFFDAFNLYIVNINFWLKLLRLCYNLFHSKSLTLVRSDFHLSPVTPP